MEFTSYNYYNNDCMQEYVIFVKSGNLIYIETLFLSITMTSDLLYNSKYLYGYYLLSIALTRNPKELSFLEEGIKLGAFSTNRKWCILSKIYWKQSYFIPGIYSGFETNPNEWKLKQNYPEEINFFLRHFQKDMKLCPYGILNSFIDYEIMQLSVEIEKQEDQIKEVDFKIKAGAILMSKLPLDITIMIIIY